MTLERGYSIETVRGRIDAAITAELVEFWTGHGALEAPAARDRSGQAVCLLRDPGGAIAGTNSVYPAQVPEIGGWRFWIYRTFAPAPPAPGAAPEMVAAARAALEDGFGGEPGEPVGLCWAIDEAEPAVDRRALVWPDSGMLFAGRDAAGRQLRISYLEPISEVGYALSDRYRLRRPTPADADAAVELWTSEGALNHQRAAERVAEISTLGVNEEGELCGISTAHLQHSERLGLELWHIRAFVAESERLGNLATHLLLAAFDDLSERFASGADTRAPGAAIEIVNLAVAQRFPDPVWYPALFTFVGHGRGGSHIRVRWFEGARLPPDGDLRAQYG